jgi:hypothetical protein
MRISHPYSNETPSESEQEVKSIRKVSQVALEPHQEDFLSFKEVDEKQFTAKSDDLLLKKQKSIDS